MIDNLLGECRPLDDSSLPNVIILYNVELFPSCERSQDNGKIREKNIFVQDKRIKEKNARARGRERVCVGVCMCERVCVCARARVKGRVWCYRQLTLAPRKRASNNSCFLGSRVA